MKATKEFFESLRSEVQNKVITSATDTSKVSAENMCTPVSNRKSGKQRESELRAALDDERKKHEAADGIERLPASAFIDYAEKHYPADQNKSAKILKEAILDIYDRKRISDEDYERCKLLGTKEPPTANVSVGAGGINIQNANNVCH